MEKCATCGGLGRHHPQCPDGQVEAADQLIEESMIAALAIPSVDRLLKLRPEQRDTLEQIDRAMQDMGIAFPGVGATLDAFDSAFAGIAIPQQRDAGLNEKGLCVKCDKSPDDHDGELFCGGGSHV